jgi:hypothetical protein
MDRARPTILAGLSAFIGAVAGGVIFDVFASDFTIGLIVRIVLMLAASVALFFELGS